MKYKKLVLYSATWCPHCKNFEPTWEGMKDKIKNESGVDCVQIDHSQITKVQMQKLKSVGFKGYPTIYAYKSNDLDDEPEEYNGPMSGDNVSDSILKFLKGELLIESQSGGGRKSKYGDPEDEEKWRLKALKYKAKYFKLRAKLQNGGG